MEELPPKDNGLQGAESLPRMLQARLMRSGSFSARRSPSEALAGGVQRLPSEGSPTNNEKNSSMDEYNSVSDNSGGVSDASGSFKVLLSTPRGMRGPGK